MQETIISNLENADFKKGISKPLGERTAHVLRSLNNLKLMCDKADSNGLKVFLENFTLVQGVANSMLITLKLI